MKDIPSHFQNASKLLKPEGFEAKNTWYHGTSSALLPSILKSGLIRSGDRAMNEATRKTMATIGNEYEESVEPVFLTPCLELAYYWAEQTLKRRGHRFGADEQVAIVAVELPPELSERVRPDVGAVSLLMLDEGEQYLAFTAGLYEQLGLSAPDINLRSADRMDYLSKLGLAYYPDDIAPEYVSEVSAN